MAGKHVDWRVIEAFPDYEINPIGEVRVIETKEPVIQFQHYGVWTYKLTRRTEKGDEYWNVIKKNLIEITFLDPKFWSGPHAT